MIVGSRGPFVRVAQAFACIVAVLSLVVWAERVQS